MHNFVIDSKKKLNQKIDMLQSLTDIEIATKILDEEKDSNTDVFEQHYKKLNCDIKHIDSSVIIYL
jgi:poly [ADP-ribose] polymerase